MKSEWGGGAETDGSIDRLREFDNNKAKERQVKKRQNFANIIYVKEQDDGHEKLGNGVDGDRLVRNVLEVNMELLSFSPSLLFLFAALGGRRVLRRPLSPLSFRLSRSLAARFTVLARVSSVALVHFTSLSISISVSVSAFVPP